MSGDSIRSLAMNVIHRCSQRKSVATQVGFNKQRWRALVLRYLRRYEPFAFDELSARVVNGQIGTMVEEFIRQSRTPEVEGLRELSEIKKRVAEEQRIVQVKRADGVHVAKPLKDCSADELDALAKQYEDSASSDLRRMRFYRTLATQMRLVGSATVEEFLIS